MTTYTFTNAKFLTLNLERLYKNSNESILHTNRRITLDGFMLNPQASDGVSGNYNYISGLLQNETGSYGQIIINGYDFGTGRVLNLAFPEPNPIRIGAYIYNIEIKNESDFSELSSSFYGNSIKNISKILSDLDEKFEFNYSKDRYQYSHEINLQLFDGDSSNDLSIINDSRIIASGIYNDTINFGLLGEFSGFYNTLRDKRNFFKENFDLINKRCSFTKTIDINKNLSGDYTTAFNYNITKDEKGIYYISEECDLEFIKNNSYSYVSGVIFSQIQNSFARCNSLFIKNLQLNNFVQSDSLKNIPIEVGTLYDLANFNSKLKIVYTNDPNVSGNYILEYNTNKNIASNQIAEYTENGTITILGTNTSSSYPSSIINNRISNYNRIRSINENFTLLHSSSQYLNKFNYSINSTDDPSILINDNHFNLLTCEASNSKPLEIINEYIIPNHPSEHVLPNLSNLKSLAEKGVVVNAVLKNSIPWSGTEIFNRLLTTGLNELKLNGINAITTCSINYNTNNSITLNINAISTTL